VVGVPGRIVMTGDKPVEKADLEHGRMPDPEAKAIACLFDQIRDLEQKYTELARDHAALKQRLDV
jgi:serine O-acetyltransferase